MKTIVVKSCSECPYITTMICNKLHIMAAKKGILKNCPIISRVDKKSVGTPRYKVRKALNQLFLRSRERTAAIQRDNYTCQVCGVKQSKARGREVKVEVHHKDGIVDWDKLISLVYEHLLCNPDRLITLCQVCHDKEVKSDTV